MIHILIVFVGITLGVTEAHCPDGWVTFGESCYFFAHEDLDFDDAERHCEHLNSHLVNVETEKENTFLQGFLKGLKANWHWIGLTDTVVEGIWKLYPSEEEATYFDWYPDQPNDGLGANCAAYHADHYQWADQDCSTLKRPICELEVEATDCDLEVGK